MLNVDSLPIFYQYFFISVLGLLLGSFANVVILRLPKGESIISPPSHCPKCKAKIKWFHNVPVFSWIFLKGRCAFCKNPISFRYPLIEILMSAGFCALFWWHGWNVYFLEHSIFYFGLLIVSFIDLDHMIIPDSFSLGGIVIGLLGSFINPGRTFWQAIGGILMGGGFLWAVAYFYYVWRKKEGMGGGDIKLLAWIGAVLGWKAIPFVILSSSIIGSIVGIFISFKSEEGMSSVIPFGPYLALGAILYIFSGESIMNAYFAFFLPGL